MKNKKYYEDRSTFERTSTRPSVFRRRALLTSPSLRSRLKEPIETWQERAVALQLGVQVLKMLHGSTVQPSIITFGAIWKRPAWAAPRDFASLCLLSNSRSLIFSFGFSNQCPQLRRGVGHIDMIDAQRR
jgi:hypothetical protein